LKQADPHTRKSVGKACRILEQNFGIEKSDDLLRCLEIVKEIIITAAAWRRFPIYSPTRPVAGIT
jgi:hypothetical protein